MNQLKKQKKRYTSQAIKLKWKYGEMAGINKKIIFEKATLSKIKVVFNIQ